LGFLNGKTIEFRGNVIYKEPYFPLFRLIVQPRKRKNNELRNNEVNQKW